MLEERRKAVTMSGILISGMVNHVRSEKGRISLKNDEKILGSEEHWRVRLLKELAPMLGFENLLRMTSTEINTIC